MAMDYRDAVSFKEKPEKKGKYGIARPRWWELDDRDEMAQAINDTGVELQNLSIYRRAAMIRHARLYENCDVDSLVGRDYSSTILAQIVSNAGLMSLNVGAACVDTLTAKVTKNRPRPTFLTSGGAWDMQIKCRNLDKFGRGFIYQTKYHQKMRQVFVDGLEFGTGFLHVYDRGDKKLACERVLPSEMFVDDLDGQYGEPRQLFRMKYVSRDILVRLFPEYEQEIIDAGKKEKSDAIAHSEQDVVENTVQVWEAWHLPSDDKAKDGRHVISIVGCTLLDERWKIDRFPFVIYRFKKRTSGFWGKGVIETVQPIQVELNRTVRSISQQMRRKGKGRTYVQIGSKVTPSHLTNSDGGDIVFYTGTPPQDASHNVIAAEEFNYVETLYRRAFQECGISELSAAAKKPSGLDAAVALREYSDIESERFAPQHQDWEQCVLDYMDLSIDLITKQMGWKQYSVLVPGRRDLLEVDWGSIDLERDAYVMQIFPTSSLPQTPSARYQKVKEMMQDGFIDKPVAQRLLEFPDIEAESNLGNAMIDDCDATISAILDDDAPSLMPLEPYQNLDLLIQRANAAYLYARHRHCPETRLAMLRNLIDNATQQKAAMMAPPPMPGAPGMPPGAPPMMPPGAPAPMGGTQVNNTLNVPPPIIPTVPPVVGG
jgi:hypothetical protein